MTVWNAAGFLKEPMSWNLRLTTLLKREIAKAGNAHRLARLINAEISSQTRLLVRHRTLKNIVENPEGVSFTLDLLKALDIYFTPRGESLRDKPIFEKRSVLECLVETRKVTFLLGAKPLREARRNDLSRWDTRSLAHLLSEACKFDLRIEYDIEDVLLKKPMDARRAESEKWHALLEDNERSVVAIGSPAACLASEMMLAEMFGAVPFQTPPLGLPARERKPFYFSWPPAITPAHQSAFALTWNGLQGYDASKASLVRRNQAAAFVLGSEVYTVPTKGTRWEMYGVIAAQRRSAGNVWLVISGLTGPATYAAAQMVKHASFELPQGRDDHGPVLWQPVKSTIVADTGSSQLGDNRAVRSAKFMDKAQVWPKNGAAPA
jgi:hypothetical protein